MDLKLIALAVLVSQTSGAHLHRNGGPDVAQREYHPSMTHMWMADENGVPVKVHLKQTLDSSSTLGSINVADNVLFYLYTIESSDPYEISRDGLTALQSSNFDPSRATKVLIHGFNNKYTSEIGQLIKEAYLSVRDVNVITVDWGALCKSPDYIGAVNHVKPVGEQVGLMIDYLVHTAGAKVEDFHIIGHSLGAHVAGFAANYVTSGNITRVTGLDPALPLYASRNANQRLDSTDALTVDCIHTSGGLLGFYDPICTHDFYPNGGKTAQPGCSWDLVGSCSHGRSYRYFADSLSEAFPATGCNSISEVEKKKCKGSTGFMGDAADASDPGLYYLKTNKAAPYAVS